MKTIKPRPPHFCCSLLAGAFLVLLSHGSAQVAPARTPTPAELARYDANRNGRLDPAELAAIEADRNKPVPAVTRSSSVANEQAVVLTPFEVVADSRGYQALNTMSGTRFNTKLEDLGSSIEVVTKQQMSDFAMLDLNDVFLYTGNTEGTGSYSDYDDESKTGSTDDMTMQDPNNANRVRGLGEQRLVGYGEYKDSTVFSLRYKDSVIAPWVPGIANPGTGSPFSGSKTTYRFYLGESGRNVSYAPGQVDYGEYPLVWGNAATGQFHYDTVSIGKVRSDSTGSNINGTHKVQKTGGLLLQSHFLQGRLIATFGLREDKVYTERTLHSTLIPNLFDPTGLYFNFDEIEGVGLYDRSWIPNADGGRDWVVRKGRTETKGAVAKPFRGWSSIDRRAEGASGLSRFLAGAFRGLSLHYNESDSFQPADPAVTITREILPNPQANGKDYGFSLSLFDDKLFIRVNKYDNRTLYGRGGPSGSLASDLNRIDFNLGDNDLEAASRAWLAAANPSWTTAQLNTEVEKILGIPLYPEGLTGFDITEPDQKHATVQLNVRNLADRARLIPTSAWPDGTRKSFRIGAPQQFILTTTFEL